MVLRFGKGCSLNIKMNWLLVEGYKIENLYIEYEYF